MLRTPVTIALEDFPAVFRPLLKNAPVFDSSCSRIARVWLIDRDGGLFLKRAPKGTLAKEAAMTRFFCSKGLGAQVLAYESLACDWLLTTRVSGEDCIFPAYMEQPQRLCDLTAQLLRTLHETDPAGCPVPDRTGEYLATAKQNYLTGQYDPTLFPDNWGYSTPEEAWRVLEEQGHLLQTDTLLHGDYCFPNIMLDSWRFSGFIDVGGGGVGDRHIDLFWGTWSLQFNLKTDAYRERFLDVYGRDVLQEEKFRIIAAAEVFG